MKLRFRFLYGGLALLSAGGLSGCGIEHQQSAALVAPVATPAAVSTPLARVAQTHLTLAANGDTFAPPVRLKAGEEYISVESPGYACPTMADVDGDGKHDLVVGQFSQGHMQFCKNIAPEGHPPQFAAAEWLKSGDKRAIVPGVW